MDGHDDQKRTIVIVGGGIIGCTTAYYLTRHPTFDPALHTILLLEATAIAAGASGKAGGLLGLWAYPSCLVPLSYRLHRELAAEHNGAERWGYRRLGCGSLSAIVKRGDLKPRSRPQPPPPTDSADGTDDKPPIQSPPAPDGDTKDWEKLPKQDPTAVGLLQDSPLPADLDWIDGSLVQHYEEMGDPGSTETAQVHPFHFTTSMADLAREKGVDIRLRARVTKINSSPTAGIRSVDYEDRNTGQLLTLNGVTDVVVAAGPWTGKLLPRTRIEGVRAHSVVFEANVSPYAVFTDIQLPNDYVPEHRAREGQKRRHRGNVDPEIYARPFGEVYACGETDNTTPLPPTADLVTPDPSQCSDLIAYISTISPTLSAAPIKARQACYLPQHIRFGEQRGPLIGPTSVPGLWVAAGHTCWGIQNGPGTGFLVAGMILGGRDGEEEGVGKLDPRRFKV
ncbi:FAD dependent oxidoreductase-domain-containing protein [Staphylotrichum tortipilum]|uniref:FAD dependent oxidoreductase-domain-containing protein n=1 Tax=Staphylotrichum tortipilum TaxID=2831512 RepID=A0AAN6MQ50_9PEZI|nr:FAD dependent oxidoreductase-domain-containing protein [Staphylotrichum longicolle]